MERVFLFNRGDLQSAERQLAFEPRFKRKSACLHLLSFGSSKVSGVMPGLCKQGEDKSLFLTIISHFQEEEGRHLPDGRPLLPRFALAISVKLRELNALLALKPPRIQLPKSFCQQRVRVSEWVGNSYSRAALEGGGERGDHILAASLESDKP